jgi:hypothetical protein
MVKRAGDCSIEGCANTADPDELRYWPGGKRATRGALPSLPICPAHRPAVEAKMADPRHWRAVYHGAVLSFRPTGVSAEVQ